MSVGHKNTLARSAASGFPGPRAKYLHTFGRRSTGEILYAFGRGRRSTRESIY